MLRMNWKALSVLASLLVITFCIHAMGKEMGASSKEKAVSEVIIEAKWGSGPGECGLYIGKGEGDLTSGPVSFTIDSRGYIYIVDWVNSRINIYDREGGLVKSIPADDIGDIAVAEDGKIYADAGDADGNPLLWGGPQPYFFELEFEDSTCKLIQREGRLGYGGGIQSWSWDIDKSESKMTLYNLTASKSVSISLPGEGFMAFIDCDKNKNFFFSRYFPSTKISKGYTRVYKYDKRGKLIDSIDLLHHIYQYPGGSGDVIREITLEAEGNIYCPEVTYEGFKIRKYYFPKE